MKTFKQSYREAHMMTNWGLLITVMGVSYYKWIFLPQSSLQMTVDPTTILTKQIWARTTQWSHLPIPDTHKVWDNKCLLFKPLHFEVVGYTATNNNYFTYVGRYLNIRNITSTYSLVSRKKYNPLNYLVSRNNWYFLSFLNWNAINITHIRRNFR